MPPCARERKRGAATDVAAGEVATLEHELRDDTVEGRALVTEAVLASAELTEVAGGLGDNVVVELEDDTAGLVWKAMEVSTLVFQDPGWTARRMGPTRETPSHGAIDGCR